MKLEYLKTLVIQNISIKDVLDKYAPRNVSKNGMCCCPIHHETHPSCKMFFSNNKFICFACGARGDIIDFVSNVYHIEFKVALNKLATDFGIGETDPETIRRLAEKQRRDAERIARKEAQTKRLNEFNSILTKSIAQLRKDKCSILSLDMISEGQLNDLNVISDRLSYAENVYMALNDLCLGAKKENFSTLALRYSLDIEKIANGDWGNIEVPKRRKQKDNDDCCKQREIISVASAFYQREFAENPHSKIRNYIENSRHFSRETIDTFGIGISPNATSMITDLYSKDYDCTEMKECGLVFEKGGFMSDCMRNRFTIEIRDNMGLIVGFTGRTTTKQKRFKYLNTPTTKFFQKSKLIFNLDKAKNHIDYMSTPYIIIVEGQCDVISLWQNGIRNVVAIMGTACSQHHARLLKMYTDRIVLCLDNDEAGKKSAQRTSEILMANGFKVHVLEMEGVKDPDELMKLPNGKETFLKLINRIFKKGE